MRITNGYTYVANQPVKSVNPATVTAGSAPTAPQGGFQVNVSDAARALANATPAQGVDVAKVERLRTAVQSGTLAVDSAKIADRIVEEG